MNLQPDAVTGRMAEVLIQLHPPQYAPSRLINLSSSRSGRHSSDRSLLRFQHRIIHVSLIRQRLAHVHSTSHIAAISVENNTEVQRHESLLWQLGARRM